MCTEYLSDIGMRMFSQCQRNVTRRRNRFLKNQQDKLKPVLRVLAGTNSDGLLTSERCRFMREEGDGG